MAAYLVTFAKAPPVHFISHLDLLAVLNYALRRSGLPLQYSEGFNPQPRCSVAAPLEVGIEGMRELLELRLVAGLPAAMVRDQLAAVLPRGLELLAVEPGPGEGRPSLAAQVTGFRYRVVIAGAAADYPARLAATPEFVRQRDDKTKRFVLADEVAGLTVTRPAAPAEFEFTLRSRPAGSLRATELVHAILGIPAESIVQFQRLEILLQP